MNLEVRDYAIRSIGCIACMLFGFGLAQCEKHHLNKFDRPGGKRLGERYTIGLCQWHHVGKCWCNPRQPRQYRCPTCLEQRGPSWYYNNVLFTQRFGTGEKLLIIQDRLIDQWRKGRLANTF